MAQPRKTLLTIIAAVCFLLALGGCAKGPGNSVSLPSAFPADNTVTGWTASTDVQSFNHDNLYNWVDGQADSFFAYGFEQLATRRYKNTDGNQINIEVWQLATSADACGLFLSNQNGSPIQIGSEGASSTGRRVFFWQNRYYAVITAVKPIPDDTLLAFGKAISGALPAGGERPALLSRLPTANQVDHSQLFFHEEISIQNIVWLGGENILNLSQKTDAAAANYNLGGKDASLILVEYPAESEAASALKALQAGGVENYIASQASGKLLAAVFGQVNVQTANDLLSAALK